MSKIYRCDRCGRDIPNRTLSITYGASINFSIFDIGISEKSMDLCAECCSELKKFLKGDKQVLIPLNEGSLATIENVARAQGETETKGIDS